MINGSVSILDFTDNWQNQLTILPTLIPLRPVNHYPTPSLIIDRKPSNMALWEDTKRVLVVALPQRRQFPTVLSEVVLAGS
jgi:hypothetical protein